MRLNVAELELPRRSRPGPGGTAIVRAGTGTQGRLRGAKQESTPARRAHSRVAALKHGETSKLQHYTLEEGLGMALAMRTKNKNTPATVRAYVRAMTGDTSELDALSAERLGKKAAMLDVIEARVEKDGAIVTEETRDPGTGKVISSRSRVHPGVAASIALSEQLGLTAREQLMTPASRVGAAKDDAVRRYLDRQQRLRASLAENAIEAEVVKEGR